MSEHNSCKSRLQEIIDFSARRDVSVANRQKDRNTRFSALLNRFLDVTSWASHALPQAQSNEEA